MQWTKELPKEPGFYWIRSEEKHPFYRKLDPQPVRIDLHNMYSAAPPLTVEFIASEDTTYFEELNNKFNDVMWYGPVQPPEFERNHSDFSAVLQTTT